MIPVASTGEAPRVDEAGFGLHSGRPRGAPYARGRAATQASSWRWCSAES